MRSLAVLSLAAISLPTVTSEELLSRSWWTIVPAVLLAYVIGDLTVGSEYSGAIAGLIAMVVWEVVYRVLLTSRSQSLLDHVCGARGSRPGS